VGSKKAFIIGPVKRKYSKVKKINTQQLSRPDGGKCEFFFLAG
jgi:hypothetical protein